MNPAIELNIFDKHDSWSLVFQKICRQSDERYELSSSDAHRPQFQDRNRYKDINPFNHSRIRLPMVDYINANMVNVSQVARTYILTQGPLEHTISHFWLMVWHCGCNVVVMLNRLIEKDMIKCSAYHPGEMSSTDLDINNNLMMSEVSLALSLTLTDHQPHFIIRTLTLSHLKTKEKRIIQHFQFTSWPDRGVPKDENAFLSFISLVRETIVTTSTTPTNTTPARKTKTTKTKPSSPKPTTSPTTTPPTTTPPKPTTSPTTTPPKPTTSPTTTPLKPTTSPTTTQPKPTTSPTTTPSKPTTTTKTTTATLSPTASTTTTSSFATATPIMLPPVLHCSAGVGRSGAFCLIDACISIAQKDVNQLNIREVLVAIRRYRENLVQTAEQLRFSYQVIVKALKQLQLLPQDMGVIREEEERRLLQELSSSSSDSEYNNINTNTSNTNTNTTNNTSNKYNNTNNKYNNTTNKYNNIKDSMDCMSINESVTNIDNNNNHNNNTDNNNTDNNNTDNNNTDNNNNNNDETTKVAFETSKIRKKSKGRYSLGRIIPHPGSLDDPDGVWVFNNDVIKGEPIITPGYVCSDDDDGDDDGDGGNDNDDGDDDDDGGDDDDDGENDDDHFADDEKEEVYVSDDDEEEEEDFRITQTQIRRRTLTKRIKQTWKDMAKMKLKQKSFKISIYQNNRYIFIFIIFFLFLIIIFFYHFFF